VTSSSLTSSSSPVLDWHRWLFIECTTLCKKWKPPRCLDKVLQYDRVQWSAKRLGEREPMNGFLEELNTSLENLYSKWVKREEEKVRAAA
ncbi:hypothetical protein PENTCL1PPCAC_24402, partial [Pristionchus entomophagus]